MNKGLICALLYLFCITSTVTAADEGLVTTAIPTFESLYSSGVQLAEKKDFENSRIAFSRALELDLRNTSALTNLALVQFKLNQKGLAIANLRKVLELDPKQPTANVALQYALSQLEIKEIPHKLENYETLREYFLQPVSFNTYLLLTAVFLFTGGWLFLSYIGNRRRKLLTEQAPPGFPFIATFLGLGFFILAALTSLKFYDQNLVRGTIVVDKVTVHAAPGENQVTLFDLYSGFEVRVEKSEPDWLQVTYPGASSGWIKRSALVITSRP